MLEDWIRLRGRVQSITGVCAPASTGISQGKLSLQIDSGALLSRDFPVLPFKSFLRIE